MSEEAVKEAPPEKKPRFKFTMPKRVWTITDIVGISDDAWVKLAWIATVVGFIAITTNFGMVVAYAAGVAIDAPMLGAADGNVLKIIANGLIGVGQVLVAGMLQLGTDFCLLFAAGLAKSKYRFTPTAALVLWAICAANTIEMKQDIYESIRTGRITEARQAEDAKAPADVKAAKQLLAQYDGENAKPVPVTQDEASAVIETADKTIADLQTERAEKVAARQDEARTGREARWKEHDDRIAAIDAQLGVERAAITAARVAYAQRQAFDAATDKVTQWDTRAKSDAAVVGYDDQWAIDLRVWGMSLLSFVSILVAFAADKAAHDRKREEEERQKRSQAAQKGAQTKQSKKNTFETEWEEAAPLGAPAIPNFGDAPDVKPEAKPKPSPHQHPDKTGDDYGARTNGYEDDNDVAA